MFNIIVFRLGLTILKYSVAGQNLSCLIHVESWSCFQKKFDLCASGLISGNGRGRGGGCSYKKHLVPSNNS